MSKKSLSLSTVNTRDDKAEKNDRQDTRSEGDLEIAGPSRYPYTLRHFVPKTVEGAKRRLKLKRTPSKRQCVYDLRKREGLIKYTSTLTDTSESSESSVSLPSSPVFTGNNMRKNLIKFIKNNPELISNPAIAKFGEAYAVEIKGCTRDIVNGLSSSSDNSSQSSDSKIIDTSTPDYLRDAGIVVFESSADESNDQSEAGSVVKAATIGTISSIAKVCKIEAAAAHAESDTTEEDLPDDAQAAKEEDLNKSKESICADQKDSPSPPSGFTENEWRELLGKPLPKK